MKVAVIGVGSMGRNHARVYSEMPDVELIGVADVFADNANTVSRHYGGESFSDYRRLLDKLQPDAVSIVVPTVEHLAVAKEVAARGISMLIEKPIAFSEEEASEIIHMANQAKIILSVGHIERFNPAIASLKQRLANGDLGRVFQIDARRLGPFPARVRDVGVVIDLAVHDLDIMRYITGAEITRIFAETERRIHSSHEDLLAGMTRMSDGTVGTLSINWLTPTKVRELFVTGERGMFRVDTLTQDLYFFENAIATSPDWAPLTMLRGVSEGAMTRFSLTKKEPLRAELDSFIASVRGDIPIAVSGEDGLKALQLAQAMVKSGLEKRVIEL